MNPDDDLRVFALAYAHAVIVYIAVMVAAVFSAGLIFNLSTCNPLLKPLPIWYQAILGTVTTILCYRK